jgi:hypothetical protein
MEERFKQGLDGYRQETLGLEQYIWRTMDDGKVRALHRQYDDRTFSWDNPPTDGHPGDAFGCRCRADPVLPERLPFEPAPPEISDEDWAALAQEVALTLALTVLAAYTGGAATPLVLARAARLASRMRGAYQAAARFIRTIKDPKTRETLEKRQESLEKAIKRVDDAVKRSEARASAEKLTRGHALKKHFVEDNNFPELKTTKDFQKHVEDVIANPDTIRDLENGRRAYWKNDGTIVIENPNDPDGGTVFRTSKGMKRFNKLK